MEAPGISIWDLLDDAAESPVRADLRGIYEALEEDLERLPLEVRLQAAGEAFWAISQILHERAEVVLRELEERNSPGGPVAGEGLFRGIVRGCQQLELDDLLASPETEKLNYGRRGRGKARAEGSIAAEVDKDRVLEMVDALRDEPPVTAHDEDIAGWSWAIVSHLQDLGVYRCSFLELESSLKLSRVRLWMGLLHSPDVLRLEQTGDFYDERGIFINLKG